MCNVRNVVLVSLAIMLLPLAFAYAQDDGVLLRYKFTPEQALQYAMTMTGNGNMQISGAPGQEGPQALSLLLDMTADLTQKCTAVDPDGVASIDCKYGEMNITVDLANVATTQIKITENDATMTVNGKEQPVPEQMRDLLGQAFTLKMDDRGHIQKVEGLEKLREMLKAIKLENFNLEQLMQQSQTLLPEEPVKVGDSWDQTITIAMPSVDEDASLQIDMQYTFAGVVDDGGVQCAQIDFTGNLEMEEFGPLTMPQKLPNGQTINIRVTLKDMVQQLRGAYYFGIANGRVERADINQTVSMEVTTSGTAKDAKGNAVSFSVKTDLDNMTSTTALKLVGGSE